MFGGPGSAAAAFSASQKSTGGKGIMERFSRGMNFISSCAHVFKVGGRSLTHAHAVHWVGPSLAAISGKDAEPAEHVISEPIRK